MITFMFSFRERDKSDQVLRCSFCNKPEGKVEKLISNPNQMPIRAYICDECVVVCSKILEEDKKKIKR